MKSGAFCPKGSKSKEGMVEKLIRRASEKKEILLEEKAVNCVTSSSEWISFVFNKS